jgi:hypothetical protein
MGAYSKRSHSPEFLTLLRTHGYDSVTAFVTGTRTRWIAFGRETMGTRRMTIQVIKRLAIALNVSPRVVAAALNYPDPLA